MSQLPQVVTVTHHYPREVIAHHMAAAFTELALDELNKLEVRR